MHSTQTLPTPQTLREARRRRRIRERQVGLALRVGWTAQALLTLPLLAAVLAIPRLAAMTGLELAAANLVLFAVPSCLANALSGYLTPRFLWWRWAAAGLAPAVTYLLLARLAPFATASATLHCWTTLALVLCPILAGAMGQGRREDERREKALRPRKWRPAGAAGNPGPRSRR